MLSPLINTGNERAELQAALRWDYTQLGDAAETVIEHTIEIKRNERRANEAVVEAGRHLIAVKASLDHGQWGDWLNTEFNMSDRTAQILMNIADRFEGKSEIISDLSVTVLGLLAAPSTPDAAVDAVIAANQQQPVRVADVKAIIADHKPARRHIYENELQRIVVAWAAEHYPGDWPENPSHTNGTYWQQLTAHLRATITAATWHESDLKIIIKRLHAQRRTATPQSPISQSPISNPSPYKSLAQMDADGDIPPLAPRPSQPDTYSPVHPIQSTLRPLTATYTAADLRTTASYRGGSRWFEARRLLQDAGIHYRDRDLVQALNNLADELEQRERTLDAKTEAEHSARPAVTTAEAADLLRPTIDDFYANDDARRYRINDMRAGAQSTTGGFWRACERTLANYTYTSALLANAIRLLADELEQSQPAQPSTAQPGFAPIKIADDRIPRCRRLIGIYNQAISVEDEYGALTGCYSETIAPKRELQKLIARLQHTLDLIEGKAEAPAEECD